MWSLPIQFENHIEFLKVTMQDQAQASGSKDESMTSELKNNVIEKTVFGSADIEKVSGFLKLAKDTEEDFKKMAYDRKRWQRNPVLAALRQGDLNLVQSLLKEGASTNYVDRQGRFPIHLAASSGNIALLEILVTYGCDLARKDLFGYTPFHRAALSGQTEAIEWLHERGGGFIKATSWAGWTPLHLAAMKGHYRTSLLLLKLGANVNARDGDGWTPMFLAKLYKRNEVVQLLGLWGGTL